MIRCGEKELLRQAVVLNSITVVSIIGIKNAGNNWLVTSPIPLDQKVITIYGSVMVILMLLMGYSYSMLLYKLHQV